MTLAIAVDLGGTSIKAALVDEASVRKGTHPHVERFPTDRNRGPEAVLADVDEVIDTLARRARVEGRDVDAIGVAVPGIVDEANGVALLSVTFGWRDLPLAERFARDRPVPVVLRHDVRAAARAEAAAGAAATVPSALFVAIGTGIASSTIVGGHVLNGASHQAGEIGQQLVVDPATGAEVTVEALASARGIADRYLAQSASAAAAADVDAAEVVARSGRGDAIAARVWDDAISALAGVLAAAVLTVDPSVIVLGGGLSLAGGALVDPLTAALQRRLRWRTPPTVLVGAFGPDAGTVGVGLDALEAR